MFKITAIAVSTLLSFVALSSNSLARTGEEIFKTSCASCHGNSGVATPAPILHGQEPGYLKSALLMFKADQRMDLMMGGAMNTMAKRLSDEEIGAVSTYLAGQDLCSIKQSIDHKRTNFMEEFKAGSKLAKAMNCNHCHGTYHHGAPRLYGQKKAFITQALTAFRTGDRKNPMMNRFTEKMTDDDIINLGTYFNGMKLMRQCPQP